ncbi:hypothetical protein N7445_002326 [Penicillium cf. griseofulvum]|nr:hypothetical protein N7445_002326 [Penicillium cf. griseofulvum]
MLPRNNVSKCCGLLLENEEAYQLVLDSLHEANGNPESPASEVVLQLDFEWGLGMNYAVSEDD